MRKLSIEVQEESGRLGGGHAVIRLMGLQSLPDNVTYRIRPVDTALHAEGQSAWIESDRQPLATRITTEGAELVVGPEIVENPAFMPGTLAVIEVAKCGVRGEFLWPRIAPLVRPKRRHLIPVKPARTALPDTDTGIVFGEATDASSHIEPLQSAALADIKSDPASAAVTPTAANDTTLQQAEAGAVAETVAIAGEALPRDAASGETAQHAPSANGVGPIDGALADRALATSNPEPLAPLNAPALTHASATSGFWGRGRIAAALAGLAVLAFGIHALSGARNAPPRNSEAPAATLAMLLGTGKPTATETDASGPALAKLLEAADIRLHGPESGRDKTEAAGLLRRYLATTLGDERTMWALTQLGSIYAEPSGDNQPDYANARRLWELSGSLGDPVAMCFVAALHEHGLGVAPDKGTALSWYQRSKKAGGCRNIDAAIQRLQPSK